MTYTAIFGGTFNPFHIGHYGVLAALQKANFVEEVLLTPDRIPPHKTCDFLASDEDRIEMCRIAAADFSKAQLCLAEFERAEKSYSYITVRRLTERCPDVRFALVFGADMLVTLDQWKNYRELIETVTFIVFRRAGTDNALFNERVAHFEKMGAKIIVMGEELANISSGEIRKNFEELRHLLPEKIASYLAGRGIYNG